MSLCRLGVGRQEEKEVFFDSTLNPWYSARKQQKKVFFTKCPRYGNMSAKRICICLSLFVCNNFLLIH